MTRGRTALSLALAFGSGLALGVWLQHRWPLGRVRDELSTQPASVAITPGELAKIPRARRLVIVCAGQSNAANYGEPRRAAGAGVYAFHEGKLYAAVDPLPGGDGYGGSVWTRLGARLATSGQYDAIVFAVAAQGSTRVADWAPGGGYYTRLMSTLQQLSADSLTVDFILWQQGEEEGRDPGASGVAYARSLASIQAACRQVAPQAVFLPAQATFTGQPPANEQIRVAQSAHAPAGLAPDLDQLGDGFRRDGVHFNARGLDAAADLWLRVLQTALKTTPPVAP